MHPPELMRSICEDIDNVAGAKACISVLLIIENPTSIPSNCTETTSVKLEPVKVMSVFLGPVKGEKIVIIGAGQYLITLVEVEEFEEFNAST